MPTVALSTSVVLCFSEWHPVVLHSSSAIPPPSSKGSIYSRYVSIWGLLALAIAVAMYSIWAIEFHLGLEATFPAGCGGYGMPVELQFMHAGRVSSRFQFPPFLSTLCLLISPTGVRAESRQIYGLKSQSIVRLGAARLSLRPRDGHALDDSCAPTLCSPVCPGLTFCRWSPISVLSALRVIDNRCSLVAPARSVKERDYKPFPSFAGTSASYGASHAWACRHAALRRADIVLSAPSSGFYLFHLRFHGGLEWTIAVESRPLHA